MNDATTTPSMAPRSVYRPQEVAWQDDRGRWHRKVLKTERAYDKFAAQRREAGQDWRVRDADGFATS